ncbi:MAG: hypothetical protein IIB69_07245 [Proteobacteria bacterium]|nr:hypothetical protein [Pseudomonadota bacterium]
MNSNKLLLLECYFEELENAQVRAAELFSNDRYHLEGITILMCHVAAISAARYPDQKDWASFKELVKHYSGYHDLFENIDLLFFYQWTSSKLANDTVYKKLKNYDKILEILKGRFGTDEQIKENDIRYQKREELSEILESSNTFAFDHDNFMQYIELFSNNQIFYTYARCEAVHNNDFPLINIGYTFPDMQPTYTPNHQITGEVINNSLSKIIATLKRECLSNCKWPQEL